MTIRPLDGEAELETCARMMASSEPWITLGRDLDASRAIMADESKERYVAADGAGIAGFLVLNMGGAFRGYIQTVCVATDRRRLGIGTSLVRFAEERIFRDSPNVFLCVSSFNAGAQRLYRRLGYSVVGELSDFLVRGHSEILMRKSIAPLSDFVRSEARESRA